MKRRYNSTNATIKTLETVCNGLQQGKSLKSIGVDLRSLINSYNGLNKTERSKLFSAALRISKKAKANGDNWADIISQRTVYDQITSATRKVNASSQLRQKRTLVRNELQQGETIFFLCSYHSNPADDHKDYQGLIYVDRFWRTKVNGSDYYKVASYIKNRNIQTIQSVMSAPIYLTTRPYCKHYFTPLRTDEVLQTSPKSLLHSHSAFHYSQTTYTADEYYRQRTQVYARLDEQFPCEQFKAMMRKSNRHQQ